MLIPHYYIEIFLILTDRELQLTTGDVNSSATICPELMTLVWAVIRIPVDDYSSSNRYTSFTPVVLINQHPLVVSVARSPYAQDHV